MNVAPAPHLGKVGPDGVVLTTSRSKSARLALTTGVVAALCLLVPTFVGPQWPIIWVFGVVGFGFSAIGAVLSAAQLPRPWEILGIDGHGLWFSYVGVILWDEIERLWIRRPLFQRVLSGTPVNKEILRRKPGVRGQLDWITVGVGRERFNIWDQQISLSLDELLAIMRRYYPVDRLLQTGPADGGTHGRLAR